MTDETIIPINPHHSPIHQSPILQHINTSITPIPLTRCNSKQLHNLKDAVEIEKDLINTENTYKSCCLTSDKRALQFFSQFTISVGVLLFSMYKLINSAECEETQVYIGLITMIIGIYLPNPKMKTD
jgi:hypothetical protein